MAGKSESYENCFYLIVGTMYASWVHNLREEKKINLLKFFGWSSINSHSHKNFTRLEDNSTTVNKKK